MGPSLQHSSAISVSSSDINPGSDCKTSCGVNMCFRITVHCSRLTMSSNPPQPSPFSCFWIRCFFFSLVCSLATYSDPFCSNFAADTVMRVLISGRKAVSCMMLTARSTEGRRRYVTKPSPLGRPVALSVYILTLGWPLASSLIIPHLPNTSRISSTVTSSGKPVTYTEVLFLRSNHSFVFFCFSALLLAIFSLSRSMAAASFSWSTTPLAFLGSITLPSLLRRGSVSSSCSNTMSCSSYLGT
mmetsp:Transcript_16053/g.30837  ORF Transcript_16053/g.30837 Transcript_16053/m.30837 type:complete len:243 (-) Transcript_16053:635-1363(-)